MKSDTYIQVDNNKKSRLLLPQLNAIDGISCDEFEGADGSGTFSESTHMSV